MGLYSELYDFAASAGSLEGYVYRNPSMDPAYLPKWSGNLVRQYNGLPLDVRTEIQTMCDGTLGRAVKSLLPVLGADHEAIKNLMSMVKGKVPESQDYFDKH